MNTSSCVSATQRVKYSNSLSPSRLITPYFTPTYVQDVACYTLIPGRTPRRRGVAEGRTVVGIYGLYSDRGGDTTLTLAPLNGQVGSVDPRLSLPLSQVLTVVYGL